MLSNLERDQEEDGDQTDGGNDQSTGNVENNHGNMDSNQGSATNNEGGGTDTGSNQGAGSQQTGTWPVFRVYFMNLKCV